jgi:cytochrome c oxidase subunit I+III
VNYAVKRGASARSIGVGLAIAIVLAIAACAIRGFEFAGLDVRWNSNAYGSATWVLLGLHLTHLISTVLEVLVLFVWLLIHGLDEKHRLDITVAMGLYLFVVAGWVVTWLTVYVSPHLI